MFREDNLTNIYNSDFSEIQPSLVGNKSYRPFLKWAGGKSQLISELLKLIPNNFGKYIEPFIGGGALFFAINHSESIISDSNEELIILQGCIY